MSKIICDICGTTYPDTADSCPICGCSKDAAAEFLGEEMTIDEVSVDTKETRGSRFTPKKNKEIFDFDAVNDERRKRAPKSLPREKELFEDTTEEDEIPMHEEQRESNPLVVIFLTVLIVLLLAAAAFVVMRYILPNTKDNGGKAPATTKPALVEDIVPPTTEVEGIPCQMLILTSGTAELNKEGQMFLLHVQPTPEDTTDTITYSSADERVATVTKDGKVTAVAEGETVINISCGNIQATCPVVVRFVEETVPTTEETLPSVGESVPAEGTPVETKPANTGYKNVTLKLKKTDIRLGVYYSYQLLLDCDLEQDEVEWRSEHPHIATVDANGMITAKKDGTTSIIATYGDQEVSCIVRCFY